MDGVKRITLWWLLCKAALDRKVWSMVRLQHDESYKNNSVQGFKLHMNILIWQYLYCQREHTVHSSDVIVSAGNAIYKLL